MTWNGAAGPAGTGGQQLAEAALSSLVALGGQHPRRRSAAKSGGPGLPVGPCRLFRSEPLEHVRRQLLDGSIRRRWGVLRRSRSSKARRPAECIRPAAFSSPTLAMLIALQLDVRRRGEKRMDVTSSSIRRAWPSIQPKQSASSTDSAYVIEVFGMPFL